MGRSLLAMDLGFIWGHFCALTVDGEIELGLLVGVGISRTAPSMAEVIALSLSLSGGSVQGTSRRDTRHTREQGSNIEMRE
jgi:hypothetical protein